MEKQSLIRSGLSGFMVKVGVLEPIYNSTTANY